MVTSPSLAISQQVGVTAVVVARRPFSGRTFSRHRESGVAFCGLQPLRLTHHPMVFDYKYSSGSATPTAQLLSRSLSIYFTSGTVPPCEQIYRKRRISLSNLHEVLIGCDGVNSVVAKWLGLQNPVTAGRSAFRGFVVYKDNHGFEPKFHVYFGGGVRCGFMPCDDKSLYWFCTFTPSQFKYDENEQNPLKMKQFVLSALVDAPKHISDVIEKTELGFISCAPLKFRLPWNLLTSNFAKHNVCVAGDALHPMTPDIGQGGCSALEDSIVLARCLAESLLAKSDDCDEEDKNYVKMERGLKKYEKERRWRSFSLICSAYMVGVMQESDGKIMDFLKRMFLSRFTIGVLFRMADFDCGKLVVS